MNNNNNDQERFDKLYELLGDELNTIYQDNSNQVFVDNKEEVLPDNNEFVNEPQPVIVNNKELIIDNKTKEEDNYQKNNIFRNKSIITKNDFDDWLDTENIKSIRDVLANKKFLLVVLVLGFIAVCIVVAKAFYFGDKLDEYENYQTVIEKKEEEIVKIYEGKEIDSEILKKVAATELISCINSKIDMDNLPSNIKDIINEINNYYNQSNDYFAFAYKDIYTGFTVSYNANQNIFTASTIKGPTDIYIYEMASEGKVNLDEELTYTGNYYNEGSGLLKNRQINTKYSVRTLLEYSTVYSDNAAHNMLEDKFGRTNMLKFWQDKGTNAIFTANNNWGITNAHDALIYMAELYRFYVANDEYGEALMKNFMNATPKFITGKNNYIVANKSGWSGTAIHDVSIVFADNPYIVVGLSNLGETDYYMSYFNKVNDLGYRLHTEYWKYKMNQCNNIKQYE